MKNSVAKIIIDLLFDNIEIRKLSIILLKTI